MKKVLMIGGTGTISLPITRKLASDPNITLYVLNRGNKNQELPENVINLIGDMNDAEKIKMLMEPYHFDCVMNFIIMNQKQAKENIKIFINKTKQFIYISTVCTLNHEVTCNIDENCVYGNAYSNYGQNKEACERLFLQAQEEWGFPVTIVRPTQTYSEARIPLSVKGKGCWPVVKRMMDGKKVIVHGDGQSVWASTHAEDFVKGFLAIVTNEKTIGEIYQIMNPESHTWDMVYQTLARLLQVEYKPVYISTEILRASKKYDFETSIQGDKRWSNIFDISKIKSIAPDFQCEINLEKGLRMYLDYMDEHPELKIEEPKFDIWCDQLIELYEKAIEDIKEKI